MASALKALLRWRSFSLLVVVALVLGTTSIAIGGTPHQKDSNEKYKYFGNVNDAVDPENADNDVVQFDTTDPNVTDGMGRKMKENVADVTDQVELKYYMQNRDCGAGSPRIDLFVDVDGDHKPDGVLNGYLEPKTSCIQNQWVYQDLANLHDTTARWGSIGLAGGPGNAYEPWSAVVAQFGSDEVVFGQLVEDSQAFAAANRGIAYYDDVSIGNRTFTSHEDGN